MALPVKPFEEAEMMAEVKDDTRPAATEKLAEDFPAGTVTVFGTAATDGLELASVTTIPPAGAGPDSLTVPVEVEPPVTMMGLSASDESFGGGGAVTVSVAVLLVPA